jgi:hypothetical protein
VTLPGKRPLPIAPQLPLSQAYLVDVNLPNAVCRNVPDDANIIRSRSGSQGFFARGRLPAAPRCSTKTAKKDVEARRAVGDTPFAEKRPGVRFAFQAGSVMAPRLMPYTGRSSRPCRERAWPDPIGGPMIDRVQTVSVPVSDQERARDFYVNTLGFELRANSLWGEGMRGSRWASRTLTPRFRW